MNQAEKLVGQGEKTILGLARTYRCCWEDACKHDEIDTQSAFVSFSSDNPYIFFLNQVFQQYQEALAAYRVWGYVGLETSPGRLYKCGQLR